jgi:AcrR family transcriptional regulator
VGRTSKARQKILRIASNLFWHNGFESTGVAEILEETGLGSGSLYWFFDSKEDLLLAVLENYRKKLVAVIEKPAFEQSDDPLERLFAILDFYRRHLVENNFEFGCPIGNIVLEVGDRYPAVRHKTEVLFEDWRGMITRCLEPIAYAFPGDMTSASLAMFVLTIMEGSVMQARAHKDITYFDESVQHLKNYLEKIIENEENTQKQEE